MRMIVDKPGTLFLGKQGENLARELAFREPVCWAEEFGAGAAQLLACPPGGTSYPVVLEQEDGLSVWRVTAADTARAGYGRCELCWSVDGIVVKSKTYVTFVAEGLSGGCGCGTDNWSGYLDRIVRAGAEALEAANRAEAAVLHPPVILEGTWWTWDMAQDGYIDTGCAASGGGDGGITDHRALFHRDAENQHTIASVQGLAEAVDRIPAPAEPITNLELEEMLK